jgi:hydroxymethylbilane synthase
MHQVAHAIRAAAPSTEVVMNFRESLGDRMLDDPLWAMPEKGVFTEDFVEDLRAGRTDIVVHSWKDLPTEPRVGTRIVATLPRADVRDVLLMRRDLWESVGRGTKVTILSSSPRRAHNLGSFLSWALPVRDLDIAFVPVRGNVPTRLRKLHEGTHHGLVVAKAALDRLAEKVREAVDRCHWMVLPISENPTGAAQGALAMEIADDCNPRIVALLDRLNDRIAFAEATREREILRSYGGGCHQKIGVTVLTRGSEQLVSLRGVTDDGTVLQSPPWPEAESDLRMWRCLAADGVWVNGVREGLWDGDPLIRLRHLLPRAAGEKDLACNTPSPPHAGEKVPKADEGVPCNV